MGHTRGISFTVSFPTLARLTEIPQELSQRHGAIDLMKVIGEETQEIYALENMILNAIYSPVEQVRTEIHNAIDLCLLGTVEDVIIRDRRIFLSLQAEGAPKKLAYLCDIPNEYMDKTQYSYASQV